MSNLDTSSTRLDILLHEDSARVTVTTEPGRDPEAILRRAICVLQEELSDLIVDERIAGATDRNRELTFTLGFVRERIEGARDAPVYADGVLELALKEIDQQIGKKA